MINGKWVNIMKLKQLNKNKYFYWVLAIFAFAAIESLLFFVSAKLPKAMVGYCLCTAGSKHNHGAYMSKTKNDYTEMTCNADCKNNDFYSGIIMADNPGNPFLVEVKLK
jgi:hypothetical protein